MKLASLKFSLFLVCSASCIPAQFVTPAPAAIPAWVVPYPGVTAQSRQMGNSAESTYTVAAPTRDVLSHFRSLFASANVPFQPDAMGYGFLIRASLPEGELSISIERFEPNTRVKITCSPKLASTARIEQEHAESMARATQNDSMKKYDTPVYPQPKPPAPPLTWPSWLVRVDGAKLDIQKLQGQLKSSFVSRPTREAIQAFYANLLAQHGYRVTQGLAAVPEQFGSWVQASASPDTELGRKVVVWVKIKPAGQNFNVELSLQ